MTTHSFASMGVWLLPLVLSMTLRISSSFTHVECSNRIQRDRRRQSVQLWQSHPSSNPDKSINENNEQSASSSRKSYSLEVCYEGRTYETSILQGESILAALERTGAANQLAMPAMPFDCRRGNCLTCVGQHAPQSDASNLVRGEDGLSPFMSNEARKRGYILTCSSYVVGDGVKLRIGSNYVAWDDLYRGRLEEEESQKTGRAAMAKVIRMNAERNVEEWAKETEETLRKSSD